MKVIIYILALLMPTSYLFGGKDTTDLNLLVIKGNYSKLFSHNTDPLKHASVNDRLRLQEGLYLKEGNGKMLSSLRVNGTSAAQTVALWHGLNINNALNGQVDANLLPHHLMNFAFVNTGSSVSGSNSMAGALLMENRIADSLLLIHSSFGSFGAINQTLISNIQSQKGQLIAGVQYHQSANDYTYLLANGEERALVNAEAQIIHSTFGGSFALNPNWKLNSNLWYTNATRRIPPNIFAANDSSKQKDESWRGQVGLEQVGNGHHRFIFNYAMGIDNLLFESPKIDIYQRYKSIQGNSEARLISTLNQRNQLISSLFHRYQDAILYQNQSKVLTNYGSKLHYIHKSRSHYVAAVASLQQFNLGYTPFNYELLLSKKWKSWNLKMVHNTSFRAPTLNDLYWPISGNLNLEPEIGNKYQLQISKIGLSKNKKNWFQVSGGLQLASYQNQILWLPNNNNLWTPINIAETYHQQSTTQFKSRLQYKQVKFRLNHITHYTLANEKSWWSSDNQLIFIPKYTTNSSIGITYQRHHLYLTVQGQSEAFTTQDNSESIPGFAVYNMRYQFSSPLLKNEVSLFFSINNMSNEQYAYSINRPMPGINFETGFTLKI